MKAIYGWLAVLLALTATTGPVAAQEDSASPGSSAEKYTLRYKFRPGETLQWEVTHQATIRTTVSGTTQTAESVSTSVKVWRVSDVQPDGTATFEHSVRSVDMRHKLSGRQEVRYNSDTDKEASPGFQTIAKSIGVPLALVTIDPRGKIIKRERRIAKPGDQNDGQMTIQLPEEAVAVGQTWSEIQDVDVPLDGGGVKKVKVRETFTLKSVKTGIATIEVATNILTPNLPPEIEAKLVQTESAGTIRLDIDAGRVVGQQIDLDKRVVGFRGEASSLHCLTRFTQKLLTGEATTASRPKKDEPEKK
jgi:hypothetical protein